MSKLNYILQPTAEELVRFISLAAKDGNTVKFTIEVEPPQEFISTKEAMKLLGVHKTRFYELINSNSFKHKKIGGRLKVDRESLLEFIDKGATK